MEPDTEQIHTNEALKNIASLLDVLQGIRRRLLAEGVPVDALIAELQKNDREVL